MSDNDFTDLDAVTAVERFDREWQSLYPDYDPTRPSPDKRIGEQHGTVWERAGFYIDGRGREFFIPTATERQSFLDLGVWIGFLPTTRVAAQADLHVTISRSVTPGATFVLEAGEQVRTPSTGDPVIYETLTDLEFVPDGSATQTDLVTAENSQVATDIFAASGKTFQAVRLSTVPYLDGSLVLTDDLGTFTVVRTFASSGPTDAHVTLRIDARERTTVIFGDGNTGRLPSGTINASYRVGGGAFGEVEAGQLTVLASAQFQDDDGNPIVVTVTNPLQSSAGADRQSIEELRREIPNSAITQRVAITRADYENGATTFVAGVARALALTINEAPTLVPLNEVWVYVVPKGGGTATQALLDDVAGLFTDDGDLPAGNTVVVRVFQAPYVTVDVTTRVFVAPNQDRSAVRESIASDLADYFDPENVVTTQLPDGSVQSSYTVAFGQVFAQETGQPDGQLSWSAVLCEVEENVGVAKVDDTLDRLLLNGLDLDVSLDAQGFPALGDVVVIDADTGTEIPPA